MGLWLPPLAANQEAESSPPNSPVFDICAAHGGVPMGDRSVVNGPSLADHIERTWARDAGGCSACGMPMLVAAAYAIAGWVAPSLRSPWGAWLVLLAALVGLSWGVELLLARRRMPLLRDSARDMDAAFAQCPVCWHEAMSWSKGDRWVRNYYATCGACGARWGIRFEDGRTYGIALLDPGRGITEASDCAFPRSAHPDDWLAWIEQRKSCAGRR